MKANYFLEYATAVLRSVQEDKKKLTEYANIVRNKGVKILFPTINKSNVNMDIYDFENKVIVTGLLAIKGLPEQMAENIVEERNENGEFKSYQDFLRRMSEYHIDKKSIESLIYAGAFDEFDKNMNRLNSYYEYASKFYEKHIELRCLNKRSIFDFVELEPMLDYLQYMPDNNGYNLQERLSRLCEANNVGIHEDVTKSFKNIRFDLAMARWQKDEDYDTKEGVVTGVLEDEFVISKKGKAYLTTFRTFNGDIYKIIVSKAKVDSITDDITRYKKGMVVDMIGAFKFPKIVEEQEENSNDETQGFVNTDTVCFPKAIQIKSLEKPFIPLSVELDFDNMMVDRAMVAGYFGLETFNDVIRKLLTKTTDSVKGKNVTIINGGNKFTSPKRLDITLDEIKKIGCAYKVV